MAFVDPDGLDGALAPAETPRQELPAAPTVEPRSQPPRTERPRTGPRRTGLAALLCAAVVIAWAHQRAQPPAPVAARQLAATAPLVAAASLLAAPPIAAVSPIAAPPAPSLPPTVLAHFGRNEVTPLLEPGQLRALLERYGAGCPAGRVVIVGHTCSLGDPDVNQRVALSRAEATRALLVAAGYDRARITVASAGSREPIASNATSAGRGANRRVTLACAPSP